MGEVKSALPYLRRNLSHKKINFPYAEHPKPKFVKITSPGNSTVATQIFIGYRIFENLKLIMFGSALLELRELMPVVRLNDQVLMELAWSNVNCWTGL